MYKNTHTNTRKQTQTQAVKHWRTQIPVFSCCYLPLQPPGNNFQIRLSITAVKCKDPGMVWNKCAGCKKTCENPNPSCFSAQLRVFMALPKPAMCEPRCECRQGTVWSNTYRKCVIQSDCPSTTLLLLPAACV